VFHVRREREANSPPTHGCGCCQSECEGVECSSSQIKHTDVDIAM